MSLPALRLSSDDREIIPLMLGLMRATGRSLLPGAEQRLNQPVAQLEVRELAELMTLTAEFYGIVSAGLLIRSELADETQRYSALAADLFRRISQVLYPHVDDRWRDEVLEEQRRMAAENQLNHRLLTEAGIDLRGGLPRRVHLSVPHLQVISRCCTELEQAAPDTEGEEAELAAIIRALCRLENGPTAPLVLPGSILEPLLSGLSLVYTAMIYPLNPDEERERRKMLRRRGLFPDSVRQTLQHITGKVAANPPHSGNVRSPRHKA